MTSATHIGTDSVWTRLSRSKELRWVVALLLVLAGMLAGSTTPASADPDDDIQGSKFVSWNLQGGSAGIDSKWVTGVLPRVTGGRDGVAYDFVALQEAGPERGTHRTVVQTRGTLQVIRTLWDIGDGHFPSIYWMETDVNGHRVNAAIVTSREPDEVIIVDGAQGNPASRPVFGLVYGSTVIYSVHALSRGGGPDAPELLDNMDAAAGPRRNWIALGDFNREPLNLADALWNRSNGSPVGYTVSSGQATHVGGAQLDYGVTDRGLAGYLTATRLDNWGGSDHHPVRFTTLPPIPESPTIPESPAQESIRVMPLGDSTTAGVGSFDGTAYRDETGDALNNPGGFRYINFVGSQKRGTMPDPDHEGHPGWRIDEIASIADCKVPQYQPNVITLLAGVNDINQNYDLSSAPQRMKNLINQVLEDSPKAVVVVAKVMPTGKAGLQPRIDAFNAALPAVVSDLRANGKHVVLVDTSDINVAEGLQDDAHPDDGGYAKLGRDFYRGIVEAAGKGWLQAPDPQKPATPCDVSDNPSDGTALGDGWRALGVIAPGMQQPANYGRTEIAEMNGDKRADYVQIRTDGSIRVAINTEDQPGQPTWINWGGGTGEFFPAGGTLPEAASSSNIRLADIDGDGRDDFLYLLGSFSDSTLVDVWLNNSEGDGRPSWGEKSTLVIPMEDAKFDHIRFADVNGDGRDDVLRVGDTGEVHAYFNTPASGSSTPTWKEKLSWAPGVNGATLANLQFADVDNDNKADYLMVGADGSVHAYLNKGGKDAGGFERHLNFANASHYSREYIQFRDISGDGKADYLVVYRGGAVRAWLNRGGNL
ncbi:FG-GAP-like repeat-containing protein [Streptomyces sp. 4F14]|uniref:FG-GAP-like repeat-containing protein n=1 Tax=Streptomyces sp. 4F14 TaxID=3394380 RepID=UPI003A8B025E